MSNNECLKPPLLMKLKRKKFCNSQRAHCEPYVKPKTEENNYCHGDEMCKRQLMNPFQTTKKTLNLFEIKGNNTTQSNDLFSILSKPTSSQSSSSSSSYVLPDFKTEDLSTSQERRRDKPCTKLPLDWSIKTDYKLLSKKPFKWCSPALLKPNEEARCTVLLAARNNLDDCSEREKLRCYLSYWIHPNISWLKLFPRDLPSVSKSDSTLLKQDALTGLLDDWEAAFESLFGLLKAGNCQYFYVCSHHTTVLFRRRDDVLSADMVPSTYGVRNNLKQEDIEFSMPLAQDLLNTETLGQENLDTNEDTGDARDFLDSLGIDSKKYSELDPSLVKIRAASRLKLDHSIRSLVRVRGSHVQGLFNYLVNNKSLTPTIGELSGVPPTLLSPTVFVGGSIRHNQVKCGSSHARQEDGTMELVHYLHLTGPLLPTRVQGINCLLLLTQGEFSGKLGSLQNSTSYNCPDPGSTENSHVTLPSDSHSNSSEDLADSTGEKLAVDTKSSVQQHCSENVNSPVNEAATIHEILLKDGMFSYK